MNKFVKIGFLMLLFSMVFCIASMDAQNYGSRKKKKKKKKKPKTERTDDYFDESGSIAHRLWYGGGFNLGFSGGTYYSIFNLGITPMVGYKLVDELSVGPRVGVQYTYLKGTGTDGQTHKTEPMSYSVGLFGRYKVLETFFLHAEYGFESTKLITTSGGFLVIDQNQEVLTVKDNQNNFYGGIGYNSGGMVAYEIYLLYNFLEPEDSLDLPFEIRFGITYKF